MIFSKKLLSKYLPKIVNITDNQMIDACSSIGLELEKIYIHPKLNNLVIGKLLSFEKHPNADTLNICKVDIGKKIHTIVTGAPGLIQNKKVIVALEGCKLHDGREIVYKELRGIMSQGMLCSYEELTPYNHNYINDEDSIGILQFDEGTIGDTNITKFLGFDDVLYDVDIPFANRNDINGLLSFCQEIAGHFRWTFTFPKISTTKNISTPNIKISFDQKICNALSLTKIVNPDLLPNQWPYKGLLMNNQIKPVNKLVDQISLISLLSNVPSGLYDADLVKSFAVKNGSSSDSIFGFNKQEYKLGVNDIVIKDGSNTICLAGIIGNKQFGINKDTKNVLVEFANFDFVKIRNSAKKYNINTDASKKFSKESSIYCTMVSYYLLNKEFNKKIKWSYSNFKKYKPNVLKNINLKLINEILGSKYTMIDIKKNLKYYGFTFSGNSIIPPPWRVEVKNAYDIAEELVKFINIQDLPEEPIITNEINVNKYTEYYFYKNIRDELYNSFFFECRTYNTISEKNIDITNLFGYKNNYKINSSGNANRAFMRNNLVTSLLNTYCYNIENKNSLVPIFEIQKIYQTNSPSKINLTCLAPLKFYIDRVNDSSISYNLNGMIGILNKISNVFNNTNITIEKDSSENIFFPNEQLKVMYKKNIIGYIGSIKRSILNKFNIDEDIYCLSINIDELINDFKPVDYKFVPPPTMQLITKDITISYTPKCSLQAIVNGILKLPYVHNVDYLYHYVNEEKNNYTIRISFKHDTKIEKDQINKYIDEINKLINHHL